MGSSEPRRRHGACLGSLSVLACALVAAIGCSTPAPTEPAAPEADAPAPAEARAVVEKLVRDINHAVHEVDAPSAQRALAERALARRLDFGAMASLALGERAQDLSRERFADFAAEYERYLTQLYVRRIAQIGDRHAEIGEAGFDADKGVARFRILGAFRRPMSFPVRRSKEGPRRLHTDLFLTRRGEEWRIVSVRIENVSVERTFREQFEAYLERNDPEALVQELRQRNDARDEENPFES